MCSQAFCFFLFSSSFLFQFFLCSEEEGQTDMQVGERGAGTFFFQSLISFLDLSALFETPLLILSTVAVVVSNGVAIMILAIISIQACLAIASVVDSLSL